jgi:hypothetical protein
MFILKTKNPALAGAGREKIQVRLFSFALLPVQPQNGTNEVSGPGDLGDDGENDSLGTRRKSAFNLK